MIEQEGLKHILISGASGNIGSSLVSKIVLRGHNVTLLTSKSSKQLSIDSDNRSVQFIQVENWIDIPKIETEEIDVFVHLSGQTSSYVARNDIETDLETNLMSLVRIIKRVLSNQKSIKKVVLAGSMTQYGHAETLPIDEGFPVFNPTYYEMIKNFNEIFITRMAEEQKITNYNFLRLANVYGGINQVQANRGFIDTSIAQAIRGEPLFFFGDGTYLRDYIFIDDVVHAFEKSIETDTPQYNGPYNIGTGQGTPIKKALQMISNQATQRLGKPVPLLGRDFSESAYGIERRNSVTDSSLFKKHTGWEPLISIGTGIGRVMDRHIEL
jgi:nucleoside-diphosphate-sugar epimerase